MASETAGPKRWWSLWESFLAWAEAIEGCAEKPVACLDVGGGWFPDDFDREFLPNCVPMAASASRRLHGLETLIVEPGKALSQPAMVLVTTVVEVRNSGAGRSELVVDAAVSDLPLARSFPHRILVQGGHDGWCALPSGPGRILGRVCMEDDVLAEDVSLPEHLQPGDRLVFCDAGAYDASMAYDFGRGVCHGT